jgi:hypothetical protein
MLLLGIVLLLIFFFAYSAKLILIFAIIALAAGVLGNGYAGSRPSGGRRYWW